MTTQASVSITIQAPPEVVWPWVSDITRHGEWSPKPYRVELVSGEPGAVGSHYRSVGWVPPNDGNHSNEVELTEVVPTSRFALTATDESGTFRSTYDLRPVGDGTEVTFHIEFPKMKGVSAVMVPLLFPIVAKPDFRKRMGLLKQKVEAAG
jgi:uncharacterized protein YndB with AHSA1/START domain